ATIDRIKALLDELERRQSEQPGDDRDLIDRLERMAESVRGIKPVSEPVPPKPVVAAAPPTPANDLGERDDDRPDERGESKIAGQSIRVNVDTLEQLMITVSELVLTRNQLLDIVRRHADSEFKAPLQRLSNVTAELQENVMKTRMQPIGNAWQKLP